MYQNLTDTNPDCTISEKDSRKILFEVMIASKIFQRLDLSDDFWEQINVRNKAIKKPFGLYEIESIDNANVITISANPK